MENKREQIMLTTFKNIPTIELFLYERWIDIKDFYMFMSECLECYFAGGDLSIAMRNCSNKQKELMTAVLQSYIALYDCLFFGWERLKKEIPNLVYPTPGEAFKAILQNVADRTVIRGKQPRKTNAIHTALSSHFNPSSDKFNNALDILYKASLFGGYNAVEQFEQKALSILSAAPEVKNYYKLLQTKQELFYTTIQSMTHPRNRHLL